MFIYFLNDKILLSQKVVECFVVIENVDFVCYFALAVCFDI